jgi:hypothetical protein
MVFVEGGDLKNLVGNDHLGMNKVASAGVITGFLEPATPQDHRRNSERSQG